MRLRELTEAAAEAVGREIAGFRREIQRDREAFAAEMRAVRAEWETRMAGVAEAERRLAERLATLKDGEKGERGADGTSVTVADIEPLLREMVAALPAPKDGAQGEKGEPGERGDDGTSVTVADIEPLLREMVAALPAPKDGAPGSKGEPGERGDDGTSVTVADIEPLLREMVAALPVPKDGAPGEKGEPGERGDDGTSVTVADIEPLLREMVAALPAPKDGAQGEKGEPGERGPQGPTGALPVVRVWEDRVYYEQEVCTFGGAVFQAARDTGKAPPHDDWTCIVAKGSDGSDGRSFTIRGTYSADGDYLALDVVALNNASFAARRNNPGPCPGEGWQLIAGQGKQGKPGERGAKGDRGPTGPALVGLTVSADGLLKAVNGDGREVECDLYPILSRLG